MLDQRKLGECAMRTMESIENGLGEWAEGAAISDALVVVSVNYGPNGIHYYADVGCSSPQLHIKLGLLQLGIFAVEATAPITPGGPAGQEPS